MSAAPSFARATRLIARAVTAVVGLTLVGGGLLGLAQILRDYAEVWRLITVSGSQHVVFVGGKEAKLDRQLLALMIVTLPTLCAAAGGGLCWWTFRPRPRPHDRE